MSRVGKIPINIPDNVQVKFDKDTNYFNFVSESINRDLQISSSLSVSIDNQKIYLTANNKQGSTKAYWGLYRSLIANIIKGLSVGFSKSLLLVGVGYKASLIDNDRYLLMNLGYSHDILIEIPEYIKLKVEDNNKIIIQCHDNQLLGDFCAKIRKIRKPEPYKGKGIRYEGEVIILKEGKRK